MQLGESANSLRLAAQLQQQGISHNGVLGAIARLPRQAFLDEALAHQAWDNTALPIGQGQTLSQPYIVARMSEIIMRQQPKNVLEIGTGSGYQTAVLAQLVEHVFTVERIKALQFQAKRRFNRFDLHNISTKYGDGWQGWAAKAPFDAIIVTAAAASLPLKLVEQLKVGGQMIIPVGQAQQSLLLVTRTAEGYVETPIENVRFVPLVQGELA